MRLIEWVKQVVASGVELGGMEHDEPDDDREIDEARRELREIDRVWQQVMAEREAISRDYREDRR